MVAFEVPPDYQLESELQAPLPRPVPDSIARHPQRRARTAALQRGAWMLIGFWVAAWFCRDTSWMQLIGLYLTPFANLQWVSWLGVAIGVLMLFDTRNPWKTDPYVYLRTGIPVVGRIVDLCQEVAVRTNGIPTRIAYDVYFEFPDPRTQELTVARLRSEKLPVRGTAVKCRVGDYRTALYLPGQLEKSLKLYGFTGVNPDCDLIDRTAASRATKVWALTLLLSIFGICWAFTAYPLVHLTGRQLAWGTAPGLAFGLWWGLVSHRRAVLIDGRRRDAALRQGTVRAGFTLQSRSRWKTVLMWIIGGAAVSFASSTLYNGMFDTGSSVATVVQIDDVWCTSHQMLFNTYEVEYVAPGTHQPERLGISPLELDHHGDRGVLRIHPGALHWPWKEIHIFERPTK
jgi:hypothetical protein